MLIFFKKHESQSIWERKKHEKKKRDKKNKNMKTVFLKKHPIVVFWNQMTVTGGTRRLYKRPILNFLCSFTSPPSQF